MKLEQEIREFYREEIRRDPEGNRLGALALKERMRHSVLYFKDDYRAKTLQIPKVYSEETARRFGEIVGITYGIFVKVIREYLNCADYRALFPFSKELEELILAPNRYDGLLPIARFDIFFHEDTGDFYFCEINTDGASAMNEDRLLGELIEENPAHRAAKERYELKQFELFESWIDAFLGLYDTFEYKKEAPNIAIVDFLDRGTLREFEEFAARFRARGYHCEVCDIRQLRYEDGVLLSESGMRIDAVYRRAVTVDVMNSLDEVQPFIRAYLDGAIFLAGSFCTQIIHNKWLFHILHTERTARFLTDEENAFVREHVPDTVRFIEEDIPRAEVIGNKDRYILKPMDSYASSGVYAGVEFTQAEWEALIAEKDFTGYVCQRYCPQYQTENIDFAWGDGLWHPYINMAGLYVYNGRFTGVYSRMAEGSGIIASHRNERTVPTFVGTRREESGS